MVNDKKKVKRRIRRLKRSLKYSKPAENLKQIQGKIREINGREVEDVMLAQKNDRRLLSFVPDPEKMRSGTDRRADAGLDPRSRIMHGTRFFAEYNVKIYADNELGIPKIYESKSHDISASGMLIDVPPEAQFLKVGDTINLRFDITPGSMPEGFEAKVRCSAQIMRIIPASENECAKMGVMFDRSLVDYAKKRRGMSSLWVSCLLMGMIVFIITLMRSESVVYFQYNKFLYTYSILTAAFLLSRYLFGFLYRPKKVDPDYTPGVSVIIPCFNEEEWIDRTILSCLNQIYPADNLEVIVVDDCSSDKSAEVIKSTVQTLLSEDDRFKVGERLKYIIQQVNGGKREALAAGVKIAKHDFVVFVDSDSFLAPDAIINLVQPFKDPMMGGVTGRTDVENKYTNGLTKMQAVRYYVAFRVMKAAEAFFDAATCLSGPLSCYRKELLEKNMDAWLNQKFLGQPATFGDDRSMTNMILKTHRTSYQDTAVCSTIVPSKHSVFLKQQMRWKRSWLRESLMAGKFIWKKEPLMALFFYMGLIVPIAAPIVVVYNLFYVPLVHWVFPTTFMIGLLMMALLMAFADMFFMRSTLWIYGLFFCLYYECVLLWQMPVAWVTFWKSTWGTRMTPQDVEAEQKKEQRRNLFAGKKE